MELLLDFIEIILGGAAVIYGANIFTDGASALARKLNVSELVIGLTIVAFGTSMPEFFVSLTSALKGSADIAVGNVVGSNIVNALLILGLSAALAPIVIDKETVKRDIPIAILASLLLTVFSLKGIITRLDAGILLVGLCVFMYLTLHNDKKQKVPTVEAAFGDAEKPKVEMTLFKMIALIVGGLILLVVGSNIFVDSASDIALMWGVPESVVGLTIVAVGTSLPELLTSIVAARKGQSAMAIGNVVGSNILNIFAILGITGLITPLSSAGFTYVDMFMMTGSMILVWLFSFTRYTIERWEGILLSLVYVAYVAYLIIQTLNLSIIN